MTEGWTHEADLADYSDSFLGERQMSYVIASDESEAIWRV